MKIFKTLAMLLLLANLPTAQAIPAFNQNYSDIEDEHSEDQEIMQFEEAREEQAAYFEQLRRAFEAGIDISGSQCKYISAIFEPAIPKVVTLTFDDGPSKTLTPETLDILKKYGIRGTFFVKGNNARANHDILARAVREGHLIANHSWSHPNFHEINEGEQAGQFSATAQEILPFQKKTLRLFRYPYGNSTCATNLLAKRMGYDGIVGWHVDTCDWAFSKTGTVTQKQANICGVRERNMSSYVNHVLDTVKRNGGGIVLMHDVHTRTVASLESIIVGLKKNGYTFANLDDPRMKRFFVK